VHKTHNSLIVNREHNVLVNEHHNDQSSNIAVSDEMSFQQSS